MSQPTFSPDELTKVSVNLIGKAWEAVGTTAEREGLSRADVINRALQAYEVLTSLGPNQMLGYDPNTNAAILFEVTPRPRRWWQR